MERLRNAIAPLLHCFEILEQTTYSSDLAPMYFRILRKIKGKLPGIRFEDSTELCIYIQNFVLSCLAIPMLNDYTDIENAFKFVVIMLKEFV